MIATSVDPTQGGVTMHRSFDDLGADLFSHDGLDLIAAGLGLAEEEEELGGDYTENEIRFVRIKFLSEQAN